MSSTPTTETALAVFLAEGREILRTVGRGELINQARELAVHDDPSFAVAGSLRSALKGAEKAATERFESLKKPLNELKTGILKMEHEVLGPIQLAVVTLDQKVTQYRSEQQRIAAEKRRAEEEIARKIEESRRLQEAEAAVANGVPEEEALAVFDEPLAPVLAPVAPVVPVIAGQSYVNVWSAEVVNLLALQKHVGAHPEHSNLLLPNMPALNQMAKGSQAGLSIPGVKAVVRQTVRGRAAL
jgi:hypothetical protein